MDEKKEIKLDPNNWPALRERWPSECSEIILYQEGKNGSFYILEVDIDGAFSFSDKECNNKYCYESLDFRPCKCKFRFTLDDKWIELPSKNEETI